MLLINLHLVTPDFSLLTVIQVKMNLSSFTDKRILKQLTPTAWQLDQIRKFTYDVPFCCMQEVAKCAYATLHRDK